MTTSTPASTLNKFGIPMPSGTGRGGLLMPKLKYRFRVRVNNFGPVNGGLELTRQVMSVDKPKIEFESTQLDAYNSRAWVQGKHTWSTITIKLRDDITNSVMTLVGHQIQKQLNNFEQTSFAAGQNYKFDTWIETMDGGNDTVFEQWHLEGCWIMDAGFDNLDYSDSGVQTIDLTVRYDNATLGGGLMTDTPQSLIDTASLA